MHITVLIERAAYGNHLRNVAPMAKGMFAMAGLVAAYVAHTPGVAAGLAVVLVMVAVLGARVAPRLYLRVAMPPMGFLLVSSLSLVGSLGWTDDRSLAWQFSPEAFAHMAMTSSRSLAALSALLMLVLTTPLPDLIGLLRRLKAPEVLLDLMVLCYRMLFVFSESCRDMLISQSSRLGFSSRRRSLRSLGLLVANLAVQVWHRSYGLQVAAQARSSDGGLRFLMPQYANARRDTGVAMLASVLLLLTVWGLAP